MMNPTKAWKSSKTTAEGSLVSLKYGKNRNKSLFERWKIPKYVQGR